MKIAIFRGKSRFSTFSAYFTSILMILHQKKHFECSSANFGSGQKISDHVEYSISNFDFSQKSRFSPYFLILHTNDVQKKQQECLLDNVEYPMSEEGYSRIHT